MRKFLSQLLCLVLVLSVALPSQAQAYAKAKRQASELTREAATALDERGVSAQALTMKFAKGQNQFKRHMVVRPSQKFAAPYKAAGMPNFFANLIYVDTWTADASGFYQFSTSTPTYEALTITGLSVNGTATPTQIIGTTTQNNYYYNVAFDRETFELTKSQAVTKYSDVAFDMCYDATTETVYAICYNAAGDGLTISTFDPATLSGTAIGGDLTTRYNRILVSRTGEVYVLSGNGDLGSVNKETGEVTDLGNFGVTSQYINSSAMDPLSGLIYYVTTNADAASEMYLIDPANPTQATLAYTYPGMVEFTCAYFPEIEAQDEAPAAPSIISLDFEGISLRGEIEFQLSDKLYNGESANSNENLSYEILANGEVIAQGNKVKAGHSYRLPVEVAAPGLYDFAVVVTNSVGASPMSATVSKYIGPDGPAKVQNVVAAYDGGKMTITWDSVTTGAHDGILGNVTYALYNAADSSLIAEALTTNTYSIEFEAPEALTTYSYYVVATADGFESVPAFSNVVTLGNILPPYSNALATTADIADWTIVNNNNDNKTWAIYSGALRYTYHTSNNADDYAITPGVKVKKGMYYTVSFDTWAQGTSYAEKVELVLLTDPTDFSTAVTVIEPTTVNWVKANTKTLSGSYTADEDAVVYFAIHAISDKDKYYLYVNNFNITEPLMAAAPKASTDLSVLVPYNGDPKGTLSFTTPTEAANGTALTSLDKVEVLVNGEVAGVLTDVEPGKVYSYEYTAEVSDYYEFTVIAYNAAGAGIEAKITRFLGVNVPGAPLNAHVEEVATGVVNITWDAPEVDQDGDAVVNPNLFTYTIVDVYTKEIVATDVVGTEYTNYKAVADGAQDFVCYAVYAASAAGMSQGYAATEDICVGTPYELPFSETFANGNLHYNWVYRKIVADILYEGTIGLGVATDATFSDLTSRNNDGGFMYIQGQYINTGIAVTSGKIAVTQADPYISLYTYCLNAEDENTLDVNVICDGTTTTVESIVLGQGKVGNWNRHTIEIKQFAGKEIQLELVGTINSLAFIIFDDITVGDPVKYDLYAEAITATPTVMHGDSIDVTYTISNLGMEKAENYTVDLYVDGDLFKTIENLPALGPDSTYTGTFTKEPFNLFEAGTYGFSFIVNYALDEEPANNASAVATVTVKNTNYPTVDITGEVADSVVTISWNNPVIDITEQEVFDVVEDFQGENFTPWAITDVADWTLLNFNTNTNYVIGEMQYPTRGEVYGFMVCDAEELGVDETSPFWGYAGPISMMAMAHESGANDAWLITPSLSGNAQTIKFMAKCNTTEYGPETMECYYSTSGTAVTDFTKVAINGYNASAGVTTDWVEYSCDVPAGAKYFAIRSTATDCYIFQVGQVSYQGGTAGLGFEDLKLVGYDIYRDQVKLNAEPTLSTTYTDVVYKTADKSEYTYNVVAVYNQGVSAPSNDYVANIDVYSDGIADATVASAITVEGNTIVVKGADSVAIAAADGKVVYTAAGQAEYRATVSAGIYVVKTNDAVAKVIVK